MTADLRGCACSSLCQAYGMVLFSSAGRISLTQLSHCHMQAVSGEICITQTAWNSCAFCISSPMVDDQKNTLFWKEVISCYSAAALRHVINSELWHSFNEITGLQNTIWGGVGWLVGFPSFWRVSNDWGRKHKCIAESGLFGCTHH